MKFLIILKILNFDKNRDNRKVFDFFPDFKSKMCSQDLSENELEVDFVYFVDPEPCRPEVKIKKNHITLNLIYFFCANEINIIFSQCFF